MEAPFADHMVVFEDKLGEAGATFGRPSVASETVQIPRPAVFLTQNEQLNVRDDGAAYLRENMSSAEALAWERGPILLKNETLADVARRLNRYAGPKILVEHGVVG